MVGGRVGCVHRRGSAMGGLQPGERSDREAMHEPRTPSDVAAYVVADPTMIDRRPVVGTPLMGIFTRYPGIRRAPASLSADGSAECDCRIASTSQVAER
jgi:hypothetical protein